MDYGFQVFSFPRTSDAFSAHDPVTVAEPTGSPPRKSARLRDSTQAHPSSPVHARIVPHNDDTRRMKQIVVNDERPPLDLRSAIDECFPLLGRSIKVLLDKSASRSAISALPASFEVISNACYLVVHATDKAADLYDKLRMEFEKCAVGLVGQLRISPAWGVSWLEVLVEEWQWHENRVNLLQSLLYTLDRKYASQSTGTLGIKDLFLDIASHNIFNHAMITSKIADGIAVWAKLERQSSALSPEQGDKAGLGMNDTKMMDLTSTPQSLRPLISKTIKMLNSVSYYPSHFLAPYLTETTRFFTEEASQLLTKDSTTPQLGLTKIDALGYFEHVEDRIREEENRMKDVLEQSSWQTVITHTERALLAAGVVVNLAKEGVATALSRRDIRAFIRMHSIYSRLDALDELRKAFKAQVQASVRVIITDQAHDDTMVATLVELKTFLTKVLAEAFHENRLTGATDTTDTKQPYDHRTFTYAVEDAFENSFVARKRAPAEMIAKYIDQAMRRGQKGASDEEFWTEMDRALGLYKYTQDKDVFRIFYEKGLAKRLLLQKSASDDFEKMVIKRLREGYDPEFGKGDEMFKDLTLSRDLTSEFHSSRPNLEPIVESLSVMVLQYSNWPFPKVDGSKVILPGEMVQALTTFGAFYKVKQPNRKLDWNHSLGTVTLTSSFDSGEKEISVSLFQALVLLLFNEQPKWGYGDIQERTGLDNKDLVPTLQSLALGKARVLVKRPPGKEVLPSDEFLFNVKFEDSRRKLHINSIQQQETAEEHRETTRRVDQDRTYAIDAAVVRIMKGSKRLRFEELKTKTIEALKAHFVPNVADIKKQIESLVMREYLERDDKDKGIYCYVA